MTEQKDLESPIQASLAAPTVVVGQQNEKVGLSTESINGKESPNVLHSRAMVFTLLFLVTGALGIPLLWMSPNFSRTERIAWAFIVTIYTAILIYIAAAIVMWSWRQIFG